MHIVDPNGTTLIVGIKFREQIVTALEVCLRGSDIYVNYFAKEGTKIAHTSYHSSGQRHIKKKNDYVCWTGGPSGDWEPMKEFKTPPTMVAGREHVATIGWNVSDLQSVLPLICGQAGTTVQIPSEPHFDVVGLEVSILGLGATPRPEICGFPVIHRHWIRNDIAVEIEAFGLNEPLASPPVADDLS